MASNTHQFLAAFLFNNPFPNVGDGSSSLQKAMTLIFGALGTVSIIVIIYSGIRLSASRGNPDAIGKLRGTIIYAAIGLFIAISAGAIIDFVLGRI